MSALKKIKNMKKINLSNIIFGMFLFIIALINLIFPYIGMTDIIFYTSMLFFFLAVVSLCCYLISRREANYEYMIFTVSNIIIGAFFLLCRDKNPNIILGTGILAFGLQMIGVRLNRIIFFKKKENYLWLSRLTTTILIAITTLLVSINFFMGKTVQTFMLGYYFLMFAVIMFLDVALYYSVKSKKIKKYIKGK